MARRKRGRDIDGVILLDKPLGLSSNRALQRVRRAYDARKAGHTGSLDPLATGLLPICLGEATKLSSHLLQSDKHYRVTARLGSETTTGDAEGEICRTSAVPVPTGGDLDRLLAGFIGEQTQIPPMYSALKIDGKPLYEYAREGRTVERAPRPIAVHTLDLVDVGTTHLTLDVAVTGGTYVRTLVEDMARAWGGCAHVAALRRTRVGQLGVDEPMIELEKIENAARDEPEQLASWLRPVSALVADWPVARLDAAQTHAILHGQRVAGPWPVRDCLLRIESADGRMLGFGYCEQAGELRPKRLFARGQA
ncbi:tRNA pseudouridine(55) synthase TruB [Salinisphaera sp.]|uniref:tRNA pseudouridine(55) synthase TruB n=1 Tax=Salinisphaera sp. TaxID=1914330 RepID=UPI002D7809C5|nr:tRNA pseudouridine(55) synthase TruB [Salinisphaera sp.]HET7313630.1 tRNA pseudouridine(55) synthase TruB [Salinisphaera sp.]